MAKNFNYQLRRVAGAGLEARLNDDESVTIIDSRTSKEILTVTDPGLRILNQFRGKTNYRAGQHGDSKMLTILEELMDEPELEDYL